MKPTFLLLSCSKRKNTEVAKEIKKNDGVKEAIPVLGTYDCIIETKEMTPHEIGIFVTSTIKPLDYVTSVLPLYTSPKNMTNLTHQ